MTLSKYTSFFLSVCTQCANKNNKKMRKKCIFFLGQKKRKKRKNKNQKSGTSDASWAWNAAGEKMAVRHKFAPPPPAAPAPPDDKGPKQRRQQKAMVCRNDASFSKTPTIPEQLKMKSLKSEHLSPGDYVLRVEESSQNARLVGSDANGDGDEVATLESVQSRPLSSRRTRSSLVEGDVAFEPIQRIREFSRLARQEDELRTNTFVNRALRQQLVVWERRDEIETYLAERNERNLFDKVTHSTTILHDGNARPQDVTLALKILETIVSAFERLDDDDEDEEKIKLLERLVMRALDLDLLEAFHLLTKPANETRATRSRKLKILETLQKHRSRDSDRQRTRHPVQLKCPNAPARIRSWDC